jgi:hypothetical protein
VPTSRHLGHYGDIAARLGCATRPAKVPQQPGSCAPARRGSRPSGRPVSPVRPFGRGPGRGSRGRCCCWPWRALWGGGPRPRAATSPRRGAVGRLRTARHAARRATTGFSAAGSLNYAGADGKAMRVEFLFWGTPDGGESATARRPELRPVLRLDTSAGCGTPVALWREDARGIEGYYPGEGTLYAHADPRRGPRQGLGVPSGLGDLAALVCGGYDGLVPARYRAWHDSRGAVPLRVFQRCPFLADAGRTADRWVLARLANRLDPGARHLRRGRRPAEPRASCPAHGKRSTAISRNKALAPRCPWPPTGWPWPCPRNPHRALELYETLDP